MHGLSEANGGEASEDIAALVGAEEMQATIASTEFKTVSAGKRDDMQRAYFRYPIRIFFQDRCRLGYPEQMLPDLAVLAWMSC